MAYHATLRSLTRTPSRKMSPLLGSYQFSSRAKTDDLPPPDGPHSANTLRMVEEEHGHHLKTQTVRGNILDTIDRVLASKEPLKELDLEERTTRVSGAVGMCEPQDPLKTNH